MSDDLEARAKREAARLGIPVHRTPSFQKLQAQWDGRLKRSGFRDIEYRMHTTGDAGDMLKGVNTAQLLEMGGPRAKVPYPEEFEDGCPAQEAANAHARAALTAIGGWEGWFEAIREHAPTVQRQYGRRSWRAKAYVLYSEGVSVKHITPAINRTRWPGAKRPGQRTIPHKTVLFFIKNELDKVRATVRARVEAAKARIREEREAGLYDQA